MFPSTGFFRHSLCPHYNEGNCTRSYCHFKHKKDDPEELLDNWIAEGKINLDVIDTAEDFLETVSKIPGRTEDKQTTDIHEEQIPKDTESEYDDGGLSNVLLSNTDDPLTGIMDLAKIDPDYEEDMADLLVQQTGDIADGTPNVTAESVDRNYNEESASDLPTKVIDHDLQHISNIATQKIKQEATDMPIVPSQTIERNEESTESELEELDDDDNSVIDVSSTCTDVSVENAAEDKPDVNMEPDFEKLFEEEDDDNLCATTDNSGTSSSIKDTIRVVLSSFKYDLYTHLTEYFKRADSTDTLDSLQCLNRWFLLSLAERLDEVYLTINALSDSSRTKADNNNGLITYIDDGVKCPHATNCKSCFQRYFNKTVWNGEKSDKSSSSLDDRSKGSGTRSSDLSKLKKEKHADETTKRAVVKSEKHGDETAKRVVVKSEKHADEATKCAAIKSEKHAVSSSDASMKDKKKRRHSALSDLSNVKSETDVDGPAKCAAVKSERRADEAAERVVVKSEKRVNETDKRVAVKSEKRLIDEEADKRVVVKSEKHGTASDVVNDKAKRSKEKSDEKKKKHDESKHRHRHHHRDKNERGKEVSDDKQRDDKSTLKRVDKQVDGAAKHKDKSTSKRPDDKEHHSRSSSNRRSEASCSNIDTDRKSKNVDNIIGEKSDRNNYDKLSLSRSSKSNEKSSSKRNQSPFRSHDDAISSATCSKIPENNHPVPIEINSSSNEDSDFDDWHQPATDNDEDDEQNADTKDGSETGNKDVSVIRAKKRISHVKDELPVRKSVVKKKEIIGPVQAMLDRYSKTGIAAKLAASNQSNIMDKAPTTSDGRVRFAPATNVSLMKHLQQSNDNKRKSGDSVDSGSETPTVGQKKIRISHIPSKLPEKAMESKKIDKTGPTVSTFKESHNIAVNIRQQCLDKLYTVLLEKLPPDLAAEKAIEEEQKVHEKVTVQKVYWQSVLVTALRLTKLEPQELTKTRAELEYPESIYDVPAYDILSKYILTDEEYINNGYPIPCESDDRVVKISPNAVYYKPMTSKKKGDNYICVNCRTEFAVDETTGYPIMNGRRCVFHAGKLRKEFGRRRDDMYYSCCNGAISQSGCQRNVYHVPDTLDEDCMQGFVKTKSPPPDTKKEFYAIDCEMCYTTAGSELTRVTIVDKRCKVVFDSFVKPDNPILDYNTRFSGVTEEKLENATHSITDVQQELLHFVFNDTILVGHSLESDLKSLKILHRNVVDTSIMYPHRDTPVKKFGLKYLAQKYIDMLIQDGESGHDSAEDAIASLRLAWKKIKEDGNTFRPRKVIGL